MTSLSTLLTLPTTSKGLSGLKVSVSETHIPQNRSASCRKVPRLNTDSDAASASRSQAAPAATLSGSQKSGPLTIHLVGGDKVNKPVSGDKEFALLRRAIRIVLNRNENEVLPASNYAIYSACRIVVSIAKKGEGLFDALQIEMEKCVGSLVKCCVESEKEKIGWLGFFDTTCKWFETRINLLVSLLTYLDQEYIARNISLKPIRETAYTTFQEKIFVNPVIVERLKEGVEAWLKAERNTKLPHLNRSYIPQLVNHLVTHSQYTEFENHYVSFTRTYYLDESQRLSVEYQNNPQAFFRHVQDRIKEEEERSKAVLPVGSWGLLRETTERALWSGRLEWLADEIVGPYMEVKDFQSLEAMYALFGRVDGLKILCAAFRKFIRASVENIVKDTARDEELVDRLLEIKRVANETVSTSFSTTTPSSPSSSKPTKQPDKNFIYGLGDSFTLGFKARRNKPAEMIAKHLDKAMRKGQGKSSDAEFDTMLDDVLGLYRFSEDKDVFRTFYHRSLAKRLLLSKSASDDFEASMLKKLKEKYDPEFGMGEDMFKDLALSRESMRDYHSKLDTDSTGRKLNVMVLQRSAWPFSKNEKKFDLPPDMKEDLNKFTLYYKAKHSGRALSWDHGLGTATLKARFTPGVKELSVSLYQAVVLLLFNQSSQISFQDIKSQSEMDDGELRRTLQSLACGKKKVLKKIPPGKDVDDDDVFKFNQAFDDPRPKVHINSIQAKVSPEESKKTNEAIEGDRKLYLDAAIVRIMKASKTMTYEKLKTATIDAVKNHFVPQVDIIKQRVDSLVEGDYLERDKSERNVFHYVA